MDRTLLKTLFFLTPLFVPIILVGGIFGPIGILIGIVVSGVLYRFVMLNIDKIIFKIYKAEPVSEGDLPLIQEKLRELSKRAGVRKPMLYITDLKIPGSFIAGKSPENTVLVLPESLLDILDNDEIEAMMAYSIVQVDDTILLRTVVAFITTLMIMTSTLVRWVAVYTGFGEYNDPVPRLFGFFIMGLVAPPAAAMIISVTKDDYDASASVLCRGTGSLISAIERLEDNNISVVPSSGFLCLVDPHYENLFEDLFKIHPAKEIRVKNLTRGEMAF